MCVNEETVNGDACLSNNGPGSVPPRNPSQGPTPQQPNFPTSQAQVAAILLPVVLLPARRYASAGLCDSDVSVCPSVRPPHAGIVPSRAKAGS